MRKKIIRRLVENALKELESVDYTSNVKQIQNANNKKVQSAYNILFDLCIDLRKSSKGEENNG